MTRKATMSLVFGAAIAIAFVAGSWRASQETVRAGGLHGRRILYYVDPMHPSYKSDKPGTAPDCNMALEPVYADGAPPPDAPPAAAPDGAIRVDDARQQMIGVRVGAVERQAGVDRIRLFGRVAAAETRIYKMNAGLDGYVRDLSNVTTGSAVRKNEWLLTYSSPEIRQPAQGYVSTLDSIDRETRNGSITQAQAEFAKAAVAQGYDRLITMGMSPLQIEQVRKSREVPANIEVTAPADGFIIARSAFAGEKIMKGTELFQIADLRQVWVIADVPPADAGRVQPGMTAEIAVAGRTLPARARVSGAVLPQFDPATQSAKIRLEIDNAGFALRPDMFVDVHLLVPYAATITVPADALVASGLRDTVFVERSAGLFEPRQVHPGRRLGDRVEILDGLTPGDRVVVSGTFLLDSESRMHGHDRQTH